MKIQLGVFIVFVKSPLKILNPCSSDICGRINNVILRTVKIRVHL